MAHIQQILCSDVNDPKITNDLRYSLFRTTWANFTPYVKNSITLPIKNNYQFGNVTDIILEQNGDFLQQLTLEYDLPIIKSSYKTIKLIEIIKFLSEYDIKLCEEELSTLNLDENFKNNHSTYNNIMNIIKNRIKMFQNIIYLLKGILSNKFNTKIIEELICQEENYSLYVTLKNYIKNPQNYHTIVSTDWIINYVKNQQYNHVV